MDDLDKRKLALEYAVKSNGVISPEDALTFLFPAIVKETAECNNNSRLTRKNSIIALHKQGFSNKSIALKFNLTSGYITHVLTEHRRSLGIAPHPSHVAVGKRLAALTAAARAAANGHAA